MSTFQIASLQKSLQVIALAVALLFFGKSLFIPLSFALLISLILYPITKWLENRRWPRILAIVTSLVIMLVLGSSLVALLTHQFYQFLGHWPKIQQELFTEIGTLQTKLELYLGSGFLTQTEWFESLVPQAMEYLLKSLPNGLYYGMVNLVLLLLVPFYVALILYYRDHLVNALHKWIPQWTYIELRLLLKNSIHTYFNFIKGVALVYLIVGLLNSLGLMLIGIPNPILFGFIASLLTFIPYIGITMGALLPMSIAWLSFDSLLYPLAVVLVFVFVQVLEANIIFPLVVSRKLKINALAAIVAIVLGGIIWGAAGMILFLPFVAILKLILDHIDKDHPLTLLLNP